jgi:hypothetical protein
MDKQKIYLLAEIRILPEFLADVKAALEQALVPTVQEPGCEALFETSREGARISWSSLRSSPLRRHIGFTLNRTTRSGYLRHRRASWLQCRS